jgi:hypothetical protein
MTSDDVQIQVRSRLKAWRVRANWAIRAIYVEGIATDAEDLGVREVDRLVRGGGPEGVADDMGGVGGNDRPGKVNGGQ